MRSQAVSTLLMRSTTKGWGAGFTMGFWLGVTLYFACKSQRKITLLTLMSFHSLQRKTQTMSDLKAKFEAAVANSKTLSERPDNMTLLKLYALYKQGSVGDNTDKKPGFTDMVGRAKWDAWNGLQGTSPADAMQQYVDLIDELS
jgi:acyl-CoA-binding protein